MDVEDGSCMGWRPWRVIFNEFSGFCSLGRKARDSMALRSRVSRSVSAFWIRSGVRRDMTPRVRWRVVRGRMEDS